MRARRAPQLLALPLALLLGCAAWTPALLPAECGPPRFPYQDGWLGGDAAYSVPLAKNRSLWLFGDTFVGRPGQRSRAEPGVTLIHNSIGISECAADGRQRIEYAWGSAPDGIPRAFFDSGSESPYWWLFDGFLHGDQLYVGLLVVEESAPRGRWGLPFRFGGMQLARVANYRAPPERWRAEILPLWQSAVALPGSAMEIHADHLYLFAFLDLPEGRQPRVLARLPLSALAEVPTRLPDHLEYLDRAGRWQPGLRADDARILMDDSAAEMSVHFDPAARRWLAVYSSPDPAAPLPRPSPSDRVFMRTAPRLEGPWSPPRAIFRVPELDPLAEPDPNTFCYAAKQQPQFQHPGRLIFTYVCNLFTPPGRDPYAVLRRLRARMDLYRPLAVSIEMPGWEAEMERAEGESTGRPTSPVAEP